MRRTHIHVETESSTRLVNRKGVSVGDAGIGVLHIESHFPLVRGHLQNARSLGIPLQYECVRGVTPKQVVNCDQGVAEPLILAARRLQEKGVGAIIGTCGSFIHYQSALVHAVDVPVFSSILMVVPFLLQTIKPEAKIGIVFASKESFTDKARHQAAIMDVSRLVIWDGKELPAFQPVLENSDYLDNLALQQQLLTHIDKALKEAEDVALIVLQCSEFAPYATSFRETFGLPVFDINSLVEWVDISLFGSSWP